MKKVISLMVIFALVFTMFSSVCINASAAGDSFSTATTISVNTAVTDYISESYWDCNYYKFTLASPGYIYINFTHEKLYSDSFYWNATLYDNETNGIRTFYFQGTETNVNTTYIGLAAGTYFIKIADDDSYSAKPYNLTVKYKESNYWEKEGDNSTFTTANPINVNKTYNGTIHEDYYDIDYYKFVLESDGVFSLNFKHKNLLSSSYYWEAILYDDNTDQIDTFYFKGTDEDVTTACLGLAKGTYFIRISNDESHSTAQYSFMVNFEKSNYWEKENDNDSFSSADKLTLNKTYNGTILEDYYDNDYYKFTIPGKMKVRFKFTMSSITTDSSVYIGYLYDSSTDLLGYKEVYGKNKTTYVTRTLDKGTYYLKITSGDDWTDNKYTISVGCVHNYTVKAKQKATTSSNGKAYNLCSDCGYKTSDYTVKKINSVKLSTTSYTYNGKVKTPTVIVKDSAGNTLKKNTDYTVTYPSGRKNAGTYKVKVTFKGKYSGTKYLTFKINPINVSKCKIKLSATSYTYNGKVKTPVVTVKNASGTKLSKDTSYTVTYAKGRKNVGTYKVTVKMKGNYTGTKNLYFKVKPTTKTSISLLVNTTTKIGAKSNKKITYSSSNKSVAKVDSTGKITAVKKGTTTITVKSGSIASKIAVKVTNPSISLSASKKSMYVGETLQIKAAKKPSSAKVTWSVSNKKLAKISTSGKLTALSNGTVTVTGKFTYKGKTYKDTYKVKITVDYPDVTAFMCQDFDYKSSYGISVKNNGSKSLTVLNKGSVYCNGDSQKINSLFTDYEFYSTVVIPSGSEELMLVCMDKKMQFYTIERTWVDIYVKYRGETFIITLCSDYDSSYVSPYEITWVKK